MLLKLWALLSLCTGLAWSQPLSNLERLDKYLFADYNKEVRPYSYDMQTVRVNFTILPLCLELTEDAILRGHVWYEMFWNDPRLAFDPKDFDNLTQFRVSPHRIWTPDLTIFNREDADTPMFPHESQPGFYGKAVVSNDGKVIWFPDRKVVARCSKEDDVVALDNGDNGDNGKAELSCTLTFGSWAYDVSKLDPQHLVDAVNLGFYHKHCPMEVFAVELDRKKFEMDIAGCCTGTYPVLYFRLRMRKRP